MSGTAAQLKIEVGLSVGKVGHGKTMFDKSIKNSSQKKNRAWEFSIEFDCPIRRWPAGCLMHITLVWHQTGQSVIGWEQTWVLMAEHWALMGGHGLKSNPLMRWSWWRGNIKYSFNIHDTAPIKQHTSQHDFLTNSSSTSTTTSLYLKLICL